MLYLQKNAADEVQAVMLIMMTMKLMMSCLQSSQSNMSRSGSVGSLGWDLASRQRFSVDSDQVRQRSRLLLRCVFGVGWSSLALRSLASALRRRRGRRALLREEARERAHPPRTSFLQRAHAHTLSACLLAFHGSRFRDGLVGVAGLEVPKARRYRETGHVGVGG